MERNGKTKKIELSEKERKWMERHFKHTKNAELANYLGISESSVKRIARKMGLKKNPNSIKKGRMEKNILTAENKEWLAAHFKDTPNREIAKKLGLSLSATERIVRAMGLTKDPAYLKTNGLGIPYSKRGPRTEAERKESIRKQRATIAVLRKKDKARVIFGLPQKTKWRVVAGNPERLHQSRYLKKRGYIVDDDERVAYWTDTTLRATRMERRDGLWYRFAKLVEE